MVKKVLVGVMLVLFSLGTALSVNVTVDDVIKLHQEGISPEVIKTFIKSSGQKFQLSAEDILKMKKAGVPEDIIQLMLQQSGGTEGVTTPSQPAKRTESGEIEPPFSYRARFHSVFNFVVYKRKKLIDEKVLEVGKRDYLKNTAERGGTLFLTDQELVMFDMEGVEQFRIGYKEMTGIKIETRFRGDEAKFHPLDTFELNIFFKKDGEDYVIKVYTLPKPRKPRPEDGDVFDIAKAIEDNGKSVNPRLKAPIRGK